VDLSIYSNELSAIHTVLQRLNEAGEIRLLPRAGGKSAYLWQVPSRVVAIGPEAAEVVRRGGQFHVSPPPASRRRKKR